MTRKPSAAKPVEAYHHGDLRKTLLNRTLSQIERAGMETVSLAALARDLGVSQSAPYRHFKDREELLVAVAEEGFRLFVATLRKSTEGLSGHQATLSMAKAYVAFGKARPGLYSLMFASGILASASEQDTVKKNARESFSLLVATLASARAPGARALRIWTSLHGVVMLNREKILLENNHFDIPFDELVEEIVT